LWELRYRVPVVAELQQWDLLVSAEYTECVRRELRQPDQRRVELWRMR
jgi:hypothetical protein